MQKFYKRKSEGFTIIETLIVLAIVGVIMIVVFLAVPALNRNSRNTQAKNEASNIIGSVNEFMSNNAGKMPTAGVSSTTTADAATVLAGANVKTTTLLTIEASSASTAPTANSMVVRTGVKCVNSVTSGSSAPAAGAAGSPVTTSNASSRQFVTLYLMEDSKGDAVGCIDS